MFLKDNQFKGGHNGEPYSSVTGTLLRTEKAQRNEGDTERKKQFAKYSERPQEETNPNAKVDARFPAFSTVRAFIFFFKLSHQSVVLCILYDIFTYAFYFIYCFL